MGSDQSKVLVGLPAVVGDGARVLVLGSLPSQQSLRLQQYYGNPRNAFWPIMGELFSAGPALAYRNRLEQLCRHRVALWDVLASSVRPGSLDASIDLAGAETNDFAAFFRSHRTIATVCFNGQKAEKMFRSLVLPTLSDLVDILQFVSLPSTSPAHAAMSFDRKLKIWDAVRAAMQ